MRTRWFLPCGSGREATSPGTETSSRIRRDRSAASREVCCARRGGTRSLVACGRSACCGAFRAEHPDWVFCHESAALAYGLPVSYGDMETVHVATSRRNRNRTSGSTRWHVIEVESPVRREGIWVTPLERTLFDCMRTEPFGRALAVVDQALRNWPRLSR